MSTVAEMRWPFERLGECVERLGSAARLGSTELDGPTPRPSARDRGDGARGAFVERTARRLGLEAQPVEAPHATLGSMLRAMAPAIVRVEQEDGDGFLALLGSRGRRLRLLAPDGRRRWVRVEQVRAAAAHDLEAPLAREIDAFLDSCGLGRPARHRARQALVDERLRGCSSGECWLLRPSPGAPFSLHLRRLAVPRYALALVLARLVQVALLLGSWWVLGAGVLAGHLGLGSQLAWALMLLSAIPCDLLARWFQAQLSLRVGAALKRRLMAGVLRLSPDSIRHQGAGQLLGRVIESDTLETLGLSGGFFVVLGSVELLLSLAVLAGGARPLAQLVVLLACVLGLALLGLRYLVRRRAWTDTRMELTHDLVELMIGHRTRRTQQPIERRHEGEDERLSGYARHASAMDHGDLWLRLLSRIWLLLSLVVLGSAFVAGAPAPELAVSLGGALLAQGALDRLAAATGNLLGVAIAWRQVGPIFHAGHHRPRPMALPGAFDEALAERLVESLEPAEVIAMPEREPVRWHRLGWAAAGLLAAAALVVVVLPREPGPATDEPTPLPEHALSLRPGASELRAADDGPVSVAAGGTLRFSLRPATSYALEPHVWACAERGGTSRPLEVVLDPVVPGRVIEGRATIPADLALGEWTLLTVVDGQPPPAEPCAIEPGPGRRMPRVGFVVTPR